MNAQRRKEIEKVLQALEGLAMEIEAIYQDEEEAFENIPESLQVSEQYDNSERSTTCLSEAESNIFECIEQLREATE